MICSGAHLVADNVPLYITVRYCWHYPKWPLAPAATPVSHGWEISQPIMDAILALRQSPNEGVWLNKLYINQQDKADTDTHIGVMDTIYHSARRVVILLEDVQLSKYKEGAGLTYAGFYDDFCREANHSGLDRYFPRREQELRDNNTSFIRAASKSFIIKILTTRWHSQAWCAYKSHMT